MPPETPETPETSETSETQAPSNRAIERVAVIGAGTMGAAIAAHAANAGLSVLLLDVVPRELTEAEQAAGLDLEHPRVRNRVTAAGLERIRKIHPPSFMSTEAERRVRVGNLEDDLEQLGEVDWIVEAIVENLEIKRDLMTRIDAVREPGTIVTTNTSGLPIAEIIAGRSDDLRRHFFGTHFFNPPRYMKLLELIRGDEADEAAVAAIAGLAERRLGKGVVYAKDTPNFIANRIISVHSSFVVAHALENGYSIEEVDAITGPLLGRPKTATFRVQDLVGIDVARAVAENLHGLIPDDPHREVLLDETTSRAVAGLLERGALGNKSGRGFYRRGKDDAGKTIFEVVDLDTFDYRPPRPVRFPALGAVAKIRDAGERLGALFSEEHEEDRGARLAWTATAHFLAYSAYCAREVAWNLRAIDRAIRWGFSFENGPFELWDRLGVQATAARMEKEGFAVADWVETMLDAGCESFYRRDGGRVTGYYDWQREGYVDLPREPRVIRVADLAAEECEVESNPAGALYDMGDGVLLLAGRRPAIDGDLVALIESARERLEDDAWKGLVIGNDRPDFSFGADLRTILGALEGGNGGDGGDGAGALEAVETAVSRLQDALQALRYAPKPVVVAVHGRTLGGGCELAMAGARVVAAAESYLGLVEVGVGLVPAGGGIKELVRRLTSPAMSVAGADPLPHAQRILETVAMAKVSSSAAEARELGFLRSEDRIVMNRDHLLFEARREVLALDAEGYAPPSPPVLYAGGRDLEAALRIAVWSLAQAGYASPYDAEIARRVAHVVAGGDLSGSRWVEESWFLKLERQAFARLLANDKTQARIGHMLETGKPLRN